MIILGMKNGELVPVGSVRFVKGKVVLAGKIKENPNFLNLYDGEKFYTPKDGIEYMRAVRRYYGEMPHYAMALKMEEVDKEWDGEK